MKILQFIASTGWGGAEKSFVELCNLLAQHINVEVILFQENLIEKRLHSSIKIHRILSNPSRYNIFLYFEFWRLLKKIKPNIVHTHSAKASEIIYKLSRFFSIRQIATKRNPRRGKIFEKIKNVTAISKDVANSINKKDVKIIYNGFDYDQDVKGQPSNNSLVSLLAVGRLDKIKGFDILIQEVAKLDFPFHLNIAGEGNERKNLEKLILDLELSENVSLLGQREDISSLIASSDLVIVSSHSEGFGRVIIETLFYGKLLLSTKVGLSIEIVPDELMIDNFKIAEKIELVHSDKDHYTNIFLQMKRAYAQKFLLKNIVQEYIALYKKISS